MFIPACRRLVASATVAAFASTMMPAQATLAPSQPGHGHQLSAAQKALIASLQTKVKYVFVFYQENRSFDSMFGTFPGANGIYSQPAAQTPGFNQTIYNTDGSTSVLNPFRIDASPWYGADLDDGDHSHQGLLSAMDIQNGTPLMDGYALDEENKYTSGGVSSTNPPSEQAKQYAELVMGHIDCDTTPLMWNYANKFTLFDNVFQTGTTPSTPGNIAIFTAQQGISQLEEHPSEAYTTNGNSGTGVPDLNDDNPFWGSAKDSTPAQYKMPYNPGDNPNSPEFNLTFASLPLTLQGKSLGSVASNDRNGAVDLADVQQDVSTISESGLAKPIDWGWWEEGFDQEPTDNGNPASHLSYITHHNGPQYFGYLSNNPVEQTHFHGLGDFFTAISTKALPKTGGVYWIKGGYTNLFGLKPTDPDPAVQSNFLGDDDHPAYSDSQIADAGVANAINAIAKSPYWAKSAIVITWDDSEGYYDHVPPPNRANLPGVGVVSEGPRVPLMVISPFAKTGYVSHAQGDQASVVKLVDTVFGLQSLASLPDEYAAAAAGQQAYGQSYLGPLDDFAPNVDNLLDAFDEAKIDGCSKPLPASYVSIPDKYLTQLPAQTGLSCATLGIVPTDVAMGIGLQPPSDFNPRPGTDPPPAFKKIPGRAQTNRLDD